MKRTGLVRPYMFVLSFVVVSCFYSGAFAESGNLGGGRMDKIVIVGIGCNVWFPVCVNFESLVSRSRVHAASSVSFAVGLRAFPNFYKKIHNFFLSMRRTCSNNGLKTMGLMSWTGHLVIQTSILLKICGTI